MSLESLRGPQRGGRSLNDGEMDLGISYPIDEARFTQAVEARVRRSRGRRGMLGAEKGRYAKAVPRKSIPPPCHSTPSAEFAKPSDVNDDATTQHSASPANSILIVPMRVSATHTAKSAIKRLLPQTLQDVIARWRGRRVQREYARLPLADTFDRIYSSRVWSGENKSVLSSGHGSTGSYPSEYCALLKDFLSRHDIQSLADLGCGDFQIGKLISALVPQYIGVDIAQVIVDANTRAYGGERIHFVRGDITRDALPKAEVAIVRQVLQHLTNSEVQAALDNILKTYRLAFITEHIYVGAGAKPNLDIPHGPGTRAQIKSGIQVDCPPFSKDATLVADIAYGPNNVIRTWIVRERP
jgi:SAM-dependent methyltransferase